MPSLSVTSQGCSRLLLEYDEGPLESLAVALGWIEHYCGLEANFSNEIIPETSWMQADRRAIGFEERRERLLLLVRRPLLPLEDEAPSLPQAPIYLGEELFDALVTSIVVHPLGNRQAQNSIVARVDAWVLTVVLPPEAAVVWKCKGLGIAVRQQ